MVPIFGLGILELFLIALVVLGFAVARKRSGVALAAGGILVLCLLVPAGLMMLWMLVRATPHMVEAVAPAFVSDRPTLSSMPGATETYAANWKISFFGLLVILGGVVGFVAMLRRGFGCATSPGAGRWWPLVLIPLVPVFFLFGSVRVSRHAHVSPPTPPTPPAMVAGTVQMAQVQKQIAQQIAHGDIHQLMDQTDAPRIVLGEEVVVETSPKGEVVKIADATIATTTEQAQSEAADETQGEAKSQAETAPAEKNEDEAAKQHATDEAVAPPAEAASSDPLVDSDTAAEPAADAEHEEESDPHADEHSERVAAESESHGAEGDDKAEPAEEPRAQVAGKRPEWVYNPPKAVGPVQRQVIATEEYASLEECRKATDILLLFTTYNHLMQLTGHPTVGEYSLPSITFHSGNVMANGDIIAWNGGFSDHRLHILARSGIGIDFVRREIAKDEYVETTDRSVGPMTKLYTLVEFSPAADRELQAQYDAYRRTERFAIVGVGAGSVLGLLGMVWGLFKFDTATKGYYTKRLFFGVPLGILGLFGFYALLVEAGFDLPH